MSRHLCHAEGCPREVPRRMFGADRDAARDPELAAQVIDAFDDEIRSADRKETT